MLGVYICTIDFHSINDNKNVLILIPCMEVCATNVHRCLDGIHVINNIIIVMF